MLCRWNGYSIVVHSVMNSKEPYTDIKQTKIKLNKLNIKERRTEGCNRREEGRGGGEGGRGRKR